MAGVSDDYETVERCEFCYLRKKEHFVKEEYLINHHGFTPNVLDDIRCGEYWCAGDDK